MNTRIRAAPVVHWAVPMQPLNLKLSHQLVKSYYEALSQFGQPQHEEHYRRWRLNNQEALTQSNL